MAIPNIMWQPRRLSREESNPYGNLLSQALKSYTGLTNAQYLEPTLKEALQKAKLFNQYYGPNIESEMGLRGAQTGYYGAQTDKARMDLEKMQMLMNVLRGGTAGRPNQPGPNMNQGLTGTPGFMTSHGFEGSMNGQPGTDAYANQNPMSEEEVQGVVDANERKMSHPAPTPEDFANKEVFGIDTYTPKVKAYEEQQKEQQKAREAQQKIVMEQRKAAQADLPKLEKTNEALRQLIEITKKEKNKELFGHNGIFGFGSDIAEKRFRTSTKNPDAGKFQQLILSPVMQAEQGLSTRGNQLALKTALASKASFQEQRETALSKLETSKKEVEEAIRRTREIAESYDDDEMVDVQTPNGVRSMTYREARRLGAQ